MSVKFYADVNINKAITVGLRLKDADVLTAQEDGCRTMPDERLLERASALDRLLITGDHDFLVLARKWRQRQKNFSGVIFIRFDLSIGHIIEELTYYANAGEPEDFINQVIFL